MASAVVCAFPLFMALSSAADDGPVDAASDTDVVALEQSLHEAETAFAAAFVAGNMDTFAAFLDDDAIFMGRSTPLRGKAAIVERWTQMRGSGEAPFSWRPERVAVEVGHGLGMSTGPVLTPEGEWISSYVSTWKHTVDGWRVVLDVGPKCPPGAASTSENP